MAEDTLDATVGAVGAGGPGGPLAPADIILDAVVVGGGLAGLACAQTLSLQQQEVLVLEANDCLGGRVRAEVGRAGFEDVELDLGAEFVHGDETLLHDLAREEGWALKQIFIWAHGDGGPAEELAPDGGAGYYYVGKDDAFLRFDKLGPRLEQLSDSLDVLLDADAETRGRGLDVRQWLWERGVSREGIAMAQAGYGNTYGASLEHLSLDLTARLETLWNDDGGTLDFRFDPSTRVLLEHMQRGIAPERLRVGCPVTSIELVGAETADADTADAAQLAETETETEPETQPNSEAKQDEPKALVRVRYRDAQGEARSVLARHAVVTAPLPVLQRRVAGESIDFSPALPADKTDAWSQLCVRGALKVVARFSDPFWPADMHGAICADCPVPEFWVRSAGCRVDVRDGGKPLHPTETATAHKAPFVLVGYATADFADGLSRFSESQVLDTFVSQLDRIFKSEADAAPASARLRAGFVHDWSAVPYVRGGYAFPSVHEGADARSVYARSEFGGRLHFAGEASDADAAYMTMHSAIRTGKRAAAAVVGAGLK